jgi:hypothetical protein
MPWRALAILALTVMVAVSGSRGARAAELVMFEEPGCSWCQRWHAEVGPAYPLTAEGQAAPLRRVHIRDQATAGISLERPVTVTPTFVLADDGREVGRIIGYPGQAFFYGLLGQLLERLPKEDKRFRLDSAANSVCREDCAISRNLISLRSRIERSGSMP